MREGLQRQGQQGQQGQQQQQQQQQQEDLSNVFGYVNAAPAGPVPVVERAAYGISRAAPAAVPPQFSNRSQQMVMEAQETIQRRMGLHAINLPTGAAGAPVAVSEPAPTLADQLHLGDCTLKDYLAGFVSSSTRRSFPTITDAQVNKMKHLMVRANQAEAQHALTPALWDWTNKSMKETLGETLFNNIVRFSDELRKMHLALGEKANNRGKHGFLGQTHHNAARRNLGAKQQQQQQQQQQRAPAPTAVEQRGLRALQASTPQQAAAAAPVVTQRSKPLWIVNAEKNKVPLPIPTPEETAAQQRQKELQKQEQQRQRMLLQQRKEQEERMIQHEKLLKQQKILQQHKMMQQQMARPPSSKNAVMPASPEVNIAMATAGSPRALASMSVPIHSPGPMHGTNAKQGKLQPPQPPSLQICDTNRLESRVRAAMATAGFHVGAQGEPKAVPKEYLEMLDSALRQFLVRIMTRMVRHSNHRRGIRIRSIANKTKLNDPLRVAARMEREDRKVDEERQAIDDAEVEAKSRKRKERLEEANASSDANTMALFEGIASKSSDAQQDIQKRHGGEGAEPMLVDGDNTTDKLDDRVDRIQRGGVHGSTGTPTALKDSSNDGGGGGSNTAFGSASAAAVAVNDMVPSGQRFRIQDVISALEDENVLAFPVSIAKIRAGRV